MTAAAFAVYINRTALPENRRGCPSKIPGKTSAFLRELPTNEILSSTDRIFMRRTYKKSLAEFFRKGFFHFEFRRCATAISAFKSASSIERASSQSL